MSESYSSDYVSVNQLTDLHLYSLVVKTQLWTLRTWKKDSLTFHWETTDSLYSSMLVINSITHTQSPMCGKYSHYRSTFGHFKKWTVRKSNNISACLPQL